MADTLPQIIVDVRFIQPGDIVRSKVDESLRVRVERPSLAEVALQPVPPAPVRVDPEVERARAEARAARQAAREEAAWQRQIR